MPRATSRRTAGALVAAALLGAAWSPEARAAACMYGPDGSVVYQPEGADCRNVAGPGDIDESEFPPPRATPDGPWLRIRPGDEHLFQVKLTHGRSDYGQPFEYTTYEGTQHREVIAAPGRFGSGAMERRLTLRVAEGQHDFDRTDLQRDFIRPTQRGYELLSINRFWYYKRQEVDYGEGSLLLPARITGGAKWHSARIRDDVFKIDETGEVMGLQDVRTPAGVYSRSLLVRYTGDIGSRRTRLDGRATVVGRYVRDVWFARGVGIVREREKGRLETIQRGDTFAFTVDYEASIRGAKRAAVPAKKGQD